MLRPAVQRACQLGFSKAFRTNLVKQYSRLSYTQLQKLHSERSHVLSCQHFHKSVLVRQASTAQSNDNGNGNKKISVSKDELITLIENNSVQLIDVREPKEYEAGNIPGAVNIPLTKIKGALNRTEHEFIEEFRMPPPRKTDSNIVFYGLRDVKCSSALEIAHKLGFKKAKHYPGGWEEWSTKPPRAIKN